MDYTTIIDTTTSSQSSAVFYGLMGAASGLILSTIGAAYASSKPNIFHSQSSSSTNKQLPEWENADSSSTFNNQNKSKLSGIIPFIPIIIAGVLAIYGLIYSVIVLQAVTSNDYNTSRGYAPICWRIGAGILPCIWYCCWYCRKEWTSCHSENKSSPFRLVLNLITVKLWDFMVLSLPLLLRLLLNFPFLPGSPIKMATIYYFDKV